MCSLSPPIEKPEPGDEYYRTLPVTRPMPLEPAAIDYDRLADQWEAHHIDPHVAYWWLWFLALGQKEGKWVGVSWAIVDREPFVAGPGVTEIDWFFWQIVRGIVFICTLGLVRLATIEIDELSRSDLRRAFWTLYALRMLERSETTFDGLTLEIFSPTARMVDRLAAIVHDPSQN